MSSDDVASEWDALKSELKQPSDKGVIGDVALIVDSAFAALGSESSKRRIASRKVEQIIRTEWYDDKRGQSLALNTSLRRNPIDDTSPKRRFPNDNGGR